MELPISVVPSFPAPNWESLELVLEALQTVSAGFQVDLVDGQFAPFTSWPFTELDVATALHALTPYAGMYELEIDCMVMDPYQYLDTFVALGAARVVVHLGSTNEYDAVIAHARTHGYQLGFALTSAIPLQTLEPWIGDIDYVQLMGITAVGQQGQPFDEATIARAQTLRLRYPELEIAVDGSVNQETMPRLLAAGVNRFAPGSAITKAADPVVAYQTLAALVCG